MNAKLSQIAAFFLFVLKLASVLGRAEGVPATLLWFYYDYKKHANETATGFGITPAPKTNSSLLVNGVEEVTSFIPTLDSSKNKNHQFFDKCELSEQRPLCDPEGIVSERERVELVKSIRNLAYLTSDTLEKEFCRRKGVTVFLVLSKRSLIQHIESKDSIMSSLLKRWSPDRICLKSLLILVPVEQPENIKIVTFPEVPLSALEIKSLLDSQIDRLSRGRYFEAMSVLLQTIHELIRSKQVLRLSDNFGKRVSTPSPSKTDEPLTWLQFLMIAFSAIIFSVVLCALVFLVFCRCPILHRCLIGPPINEEPVGPPVYFVNGRGRDFSVTDYETVCSMK